MDDGYDIADYYNVHEDYGTIEDFKALVKAAHQRGLKVIADLVLNHTSDQHPWFSGRPVGPPNPSITIITSGPITKISTVMRVSSSLIRKNQTGPMMKKAGQYFWHPVLFPPSPI